MIKCLIPGFLSIIILGSAILTISSCKPDGNDDNTPTLKISPRNDFEGTGINQIIEVTFNLNMAGTLPVTFTYSTVDSLAKANDDFIPVIDQSLVFNPGETSKTVNIEIVSDSAIEFNEYFKIIITHVENANVEEPSLTICLINDDYPRPILTEDGYISPDVYPELKMDFADEFNDTILSIFNWTYELGEGKWGFDQMQEYTISPENLSVKDGKLRITAINNGGHYTSARINTASKRTVKYGLIEMRVKLPRGKGIWPAFWMLSVECAGNNWPSCGEIDLAELNGQVPGTIIGTAYYDSSGPRKKEGFYSLPDFTETFADQFHVISILWQPDNIEWMVDNKKYMEFNKASAGQTWPYNNFFYLYINLAVGGTLVGEPDNSTDFPQTMEVDYIRTYIPRD